MLLQFSWWSEVDRDLKISDVVIGIITCRFQRHNPSLRLQSANQKPRLLQVTNQKPVHPLQNRHLHLSMPCQLPPTHNWMLSRTLHSCPLIGCFEQLNLLIGPILLLIWAPPGGALFQSSISSVHMEHKTLQTPPRIFVPSLTLQVKKSFMLRINSIEMPSVTLNNIKKCHPSKISLQVSRLL